MSKIKSAVWRWVYVNVQMVFNFISSEVTVPEDSDDEFAYEEVSFCLLNPCWLL